MNRWLSVVIVAGAFGAAMACSNDTQIVGTEAVASHTSSPEAFVGAWRSVTPSLEFIRLSVHSKSSEKGMLAARLTFSGLAWEGTGQMSGDSLVAAMSVVGVKESSAVMVTHARDARTLRMQLEREVGTLELTFVRED